MDSYDAIIYGNDLSALITAYLILKKEKRVLLADPNERVGNFTDYYQKRRFTFNNIYNTLSFDSNDKDDLVSNIIQELNIDTSFVSDNKLAHIISINKENNIKKEYILPVGIDDFSNKIEEYIPGSKNSIIDFFSLAEECDTAIKYFLTYGIDEKEMKERFPNFVRVINKSVSEVLDYLKIPIEAQEILNFCWVYFSTSETDLAFIDYASFMYNLVKNNIKVPTKNYEELSFEIFKKYLNGGGNYINNVTLNKIICLNKEVTGAIFNNEIYYTSNLITSLNPSKIYNSLIEKSEVPKEALRLCNKRVYDGSPFTIFLGLNRTAEELKLDSSKYFIWNNMDSDVEYNKMSSINNDNSIVTIQNYYRPDVSPEGTSIISIESYFFKNSFEEYLSCDNYKNSIADITNNLITAFEEKTGIRIRDYIEEMQVITPIDYYIKYKDSSYFGYKLKPLDNTIMRYKNRIEEEYIKGLLFHGKYGIFGGTFNNMLLTSKIIADKIDERR